MPLRIDNFRQVGWFVIDGRIWRNNRGWLFWLRTPIFGLVIQKDWRDWLYVDTLKTSWALGLLCKQFGDDGDHMYVWNWEHVWSRKSLFQEVTSVT